MAEFTLGLILSLLRNLSPAYSSMKDGLWLKKDLKGEELEGKKIGVIGYGHIGKKLTKLLNAFGTKVDYYSRSEKSNSLENIFKHSDIITIHLPLNNETENLINNNLLSLMRPTSFLINTSRGGVVEEKVLLFIASEKLISNNDKILVGLSGGADSVFLLSFLKKFQKKFNLSLIAVHLNHNLRGNEADEDESFCRKFCLRSQKPNPFLLR